MEAVTIYHNGQCTKSGGALELLILNDIPHNVRFYMAEPLSEAELRDLLQKLGLKPRDIVRDYEQLYADLYQGKELSDDEWIKALLEHPELMQRPIIEKHDSAFVARPPELVLDLLK